jgi:glyoxylate reductase
MNDHLRIFITSPLPREALQVLRPHSSRLTVWKDHLTLKKRLLLKEVRDADGLLCLLTDEVDERLMIGAPRLKVIANCAVGFDNVDVAAATRRGIMVTNTPGVLTDATADLTWALLMAVARRIPEADRFLRAGEYREWELFLMLGAPVYGRTIGIVGSGRVGTAVALRAKGFQMKVLYTDTFSNERIEKEAGAKRVDLQTLLRSSDFVCIHVPYTKSTHHLIGRKEFSLMKLSAILINTARGEIVDEKALVEALKTRRIGAAGLDVYEHEPKVPGSLRRLPNVVLLPHIGSATLETRTKMAVSAAKNLVAALGDQVPPNLVNPEVLKTFR